MTQVEKIKKDIQEMETALSMPSINDMPKVKKRLETDLETARQQLESLQKKSNPQPIEKTGQLPGQETQNKEKTPAQKWEEVREKLPVMAKAYDEFTQAPTVAPKPTSTIHFAGQQYPGQYTRGELWSDVRQNFKLVLLSATFRRCLGRGDYSELWSTVLFVKLWQGIHEGLKKLEGGKDYTMEELLIRHWAYGEDMKEAGRVLAEFLKQPKPE